MPSDPQYGRRHFMKDSIMSLAKTAQEFVKYRDAPPEKAAPAERCDWLRPPGAVPEPVFLERCTRCGDCIKACPHGSITFEAHDGSPLLFPDEKPCFLCEDLPCIAACAEEALLPPASREMVKMGVAAVSLRNCTADQGCNACVAQCPTEAIAMDFDALRIVVVEGQCVGCGLCQHTCKTVNDKIAIMVVPARFLSLPMSDEISRH